MLYYERIYTSEGIDVNKTSASKECNIGYFLNKGYKFQTYACIRCHHLLIMCTKICKISRICRVKL